MFDLVQDMNMKQLRVESRVEDIETQLKRIQVGVVCTGASTYDVIADSSRATTGANSKADGRVAWSST